MKKNEKAFEDWTREEMEVALSFIKSALDRGAEIQRVGPNPVLVKIKDGSFSSLFGGLYIKFPEAD